jgi:hypothetical protein
MRARVGVVSTVRKRRKRASHPASQMMTHPSIGGERDQELGRKLGILLWDMDKTLTRVT